MAREFNKGSENMAEKADGLTPHQVFDAVSSEVLSAPPAAWDDQDVIFASLGRMIEALPQKGMIPDETADKWLRRTFRMETWEAVNERTRYLAHRGYTQEMIEEARKPVAQDLETAFRQTAWHIRRASGIGGSELGAVICGWKKERSLGFSSATNIVRSKLLIDAPFGGQDQLRRGHRMEERILEDYHARTGAVRDTESLSKLRGFRPSKLPWLIGNPDDIVMRPVWENGREVTKRIIPDSKAPSQKEIEKYQDDTKGVPFDYRAQLHGYGAVCYMAGIPCHGYELVPFDYNKGDIDIIPVPHDKDLLADIVHATRWAWQECVMKGHVPEPVTTPDLEFSEDEMVIMNSLIYERQVAKSMFDVAKETVDFLGAQMKAFIGNKRGKFLPKEGFGTYEVSVKYDVDKLRSIGQGVDGFDEIAFRTPDKVADAESVEKLLGRISRAANMQEAGDLIGQATADRAFAADKWDASGMARALVELGVDVSAAEIWGHSYASTRKKSGPELESLNRFKSKAGDIVDDVLSYMNEDERKREILTGNTDETSPDDEYGQEP